MINSFEVNVRTFPSKPQVPVNSSKVIALPGPVDHAFIARKPNDGWESIDKLDMDIRTGPSKDAHKKAFTKEKAIIDYSLPVTRAELEDDENDYGGLGKYGPGHYPDDVEVKVDVIANKGKPVFVESNEDFAWLIPGIIAGGRHPIHNQFINKLSDFGAIVTLTESSLEEKDHKGFNYLFVPTVDGYTTDLLKICDFIETQEENNKATFIHCLDGNGRTGTMLAAYLIYKGYLTVDEAIEYIHQNYSADAIKTKYQEDELHRFSAWL